MAGKASSGVDFRSFFLMGFGVQGLGCRVKEIRPKVTDGAGAAVLDDGRLVTWGDAGGPRRKIKGCCFRLRTQGFKPCTWVADSRVVCFSGSRHGPLPNVRQVCNFACG